MTGKEKCCTHATDDSQKLIFFDALTSVCLYSGKHEVKKHLSFCVQRHAADLEDAQVDQCIVIAVKLNNRIIT